MLKLKELILDRAPGLGEITQQMDVSPADRSFERARRCSERPRQPERAPAIDAIQQRGEFGLAIIQEPDLVVAARQQFANLRDVLLAQRIARLDMRRQRTLIIIGS